MAERLSSGAEMWIRTKGWPFLEYSRARYPERRCFCDFWMNYTRGYVSWLILRGWYEFDWALWTRLFRHRYHFSGKLGKTKYLPNNTGINHWLSRNAGVAIMSEDGLCTESAVSTAKDYGMLVAHAFEWVHRCAAAFNAAWIHSVESFCLTQHWPLSSNSICTFHPHSSPALSCQIHSTSYRSLLCSRFSGQVSGLYVLTVRAQ